MSNIGVYYDHFVIPFNVGVAVLFAVVLYKYVRWFYKLPKADKKLVGRGLFSTKTFGALGEVFSESLLHRRIFKVNPLLGYMHMSLAFGWFLLIAFGWIEATFHLSGMIPLHAHVFYKFFDQGSSSSSALLMANIMDLLLLFVLSGVALAWYKRWKSRSMGMKRTTKHTLGDKIALSSLWFIFPVRLLAESSTSGLKGFSSIITGNLGALMINTFGIEAVSVMSSVLWWTYSILLMVFFVAMPFSRYMHIFTEIPLIFLRRYKLRSEPWKKSFDHFQIEACSRCGICIDPCQLQKDAGINNVQSVYFLRDRRYGQLSDEVASNCLMCGRCEIKCPVGIELNTLRLNSRTEFSDVPAHNKYSYLKDVDRSVGEGRVGYFAGCMTLQAPKILKSMEAIFSSAKEDVWWADKDGSVCCGRPLMLSGEISSSQKMIDYNKKLFAKHKITTLVTSCPICLKVFKESYNLEGIEVLHHSQYILRLMNEKRITVQMGSRMFTYHDPCELGRGSGIYDEPREIINNVGGFVEVAENRENAFCCGSSLANVVINDKQQNSISLSLAERFGDTGADTVVTACPLCKKAIARNVDDVRDLSEIVAEALIV